MWKGFQANSSTFLKTQKIHLYPNRVSLIQFPCAVQKTISGSSLDLNVRIDNNTPQELYLWLKSAKAEPTNLIVKCQEKFFIFDIYAQKHSHQDYIKILSGFQSPKLKLKKIDGSGKKARKP